ncbi:XRE family transcriptional regulator [Bosea sp. (in: a-proteobacteria)]|uniref:XRE family transcriptional regulator n=1 Tax=Bosea sp. (in: a-proteobacteria) TaxID=1871050 RepID=UPI0026060827|nr:XRE family transcriptional regulator [Bosea sp. (in: a-proteobacteria)]MCO5092639.1 XRE family transcriptional regulator [Bosea sp. (in: a-proteobacteria)]
MDWRQRLLNAAEKTGRSDRSISLAANLGPNALNEIRNTSKEPSVERTLKLIEEIGVSRSYVFLGIEITPDVEEIVELLGRASPLARQGFAAFLRERQPPEAKTAPQPDPQAAASENREASR